MSSLDFAEKKHKSRNAIKGFLLFYFLACIADGFVLMFLGVPVVLHLFVTQLTLGEVVGVLLVDLALSIVVTPALMWLAGTMIRAKYRKEVL